MTPAIHAARKAKIAHRVHEYTHDASSESYGVEAAEKLGFSQDRVFKTLVVAMPEDKKICFDRAYLRGARTCGQRRFVGDFFYMQLKIMGT